MHVIKTHITDHFPIYCQITISESSTQEISETPKRRNKIDYNLFKGKIKELNWEDFYHENDVNLAAQKLTKMIQNCRVESVVENEVKSNKKTILKPWITPGILKSIRKRDRMYAKTLKQPYNTTLQTKYILYRNVLGKLLKEEREQYFIKKLESNEGNMKETWKIINEAANRVTKQKKCFPIEEWQNSKGEVQSEKEVANILNNYFSTVGAELASKIPKPSKKPEYKTNRYTNPARSIFLFKIEENEILKITQTMRGGTAPGPDELPPQAIKDIIELIATPLTHLFNLSITRGIFPQAFKVAKVVPLFKKGVTTDPANYRPISLINVIAKIFEKLLKTRLVKFLEENNVIDSHQFGFQNRISTQDALFKVTEEMYHKLDQGEKVVLTCLDVAKAFDSISKTTLAEKMEKTGIRGLALSLFMSYIENREQEVHIGDAISDSAIIRDFGCSQGTSIGPIIFLIYVNNLAAQDYLGELYMFADDVALINSGKTWREAHEAAEKDLRTIGYWMNANTLTVNPSKSSFMNIARRRDPEEESALPLKYHTCEKAPCSCPSLEKVETLNYLGVVVDHRLKWDAHVQSLCQRLRKCAYVLYSIKFFSRQLLKITYRALFESLLQYAITIWGGSFSYLIDKLFKIQKITLKILYNKPRRYPTNVLFRELELPTVHQIYARNILIFALKHKQIFFADIRERLANKYRLKLPKVNHQYAQRTATYKGMQIINKEFSKIVEITKLNNDKLAKKEITKLIYSKPYDYFDSS